MTKVIQLTNCSGNPRRCVEVVMPEENVESSNSWFPPPHYIQQSQPVLSSGGQLNGSRGDQSYQIYRSFFLPTCIYTLCFNERIVHDREGLNCMWVIFYGYTQVFNLKYIGDYEHCKRINLVQSNNRVLIYEKQNFKVLLSVRKGWIK